MVLFSAQAPKDRLFILAPHEYVGVYTFLPDGKVAMAVMNDYAIAQVIVQ